MSLHLRRLGIASAFVLLAVGGAYFLWSRSDLATAAARLELVRESAGKEGMAIDYSALHPVGIQSSQNGAADYLQAIKRAEAASRGTRKAIEPFSRRDALGRATPAEIRELRRAMPGWQAAFDSTDRALRRPRIVIDREYEKGVELLLPDLAQARSLRMALIAKALLQAHDGSYADGFATLAKAAKLVGHMHDDPVTISRLVQAADQDRVLTALESILSRAPLTSQTVAGARQVLDGIGPPIDFHSMLRTEAIFSIELPGHLAQTNRPETLVAVLDGSNGVKLSTVEARMLRMTTVQRAAETRAIEHWRQVFRDLPKDPTDYEGALRVLEAAKESSARDKGIESKVLLATMMEFRTMLTGLKSSLAHRRAAELALQVFDFRIREGRFPERISGPMDPYDGKPIRYRTTPKGFVAYSVGANDTSPPRSNFESVIFDFAYPAPK